MAETLVVPYNSVPELAEDVACVIVEPVAANMGLVPPQPGFLEGLRAACDEAGALLIFDEVITGFRIGPSGASGETGVRPDLWCFGKVIGGGLPVGAVGGRAEVLAVLAPDGPVYQAGTLSGNPLATAAGIAVLEALDVASYTELAGRVSFGRRARGCLNDALTAGSVGDARRPFVAQVPVVGPLFGVFFTTAGASPRGRLRRSGGGCRHRALSALLPRHPPPGGGHRPRALRGGLPLDGPGPPNSSGPCRPPDRPRRMAGDWRRSDHPGPAVGQYEECGPMRTRARCVLRARSSGPFCWPKYESRGRVTTVRRRWKRP